MSYRNIARILMGGSLGRAPKGSSELSSIRTHRMDTPRRTPRALQRDENPHLRRGEPDHRGLADDGDGRLHRELGEFEHLDPAKRLERIAEHEIITLLQLQRFDPTTSEWLTVARALVEYGYAVFRAWVGVGVVRTMAASHAGGRGVIGLSKIPEGLRLDDDDAHALIASTMTMPTLSLPT